MEHPEPAQHDTGMCPHGNFPDSCQLCVAQEQAEAPKSDVIEFQQMPTFRRTDGSYDIVPEAALRTTAEDVASGDWQFDKLTRVLGEKLGHLPLYLTRPDLIRDEKTRERVAALREGNPLFIPMPTEGLDPDFLTAAQKFTDAESGVMLRPHKGGRALDLFSALRYRDGREARLLRGKTHEEEDFSSRLQLLAPLIESQKVSDRQTAYAMEYLHDGVRPETVTQDQITDWLERVRSSGLKFGFDVDATPNSLDNFLLRDGKLFWIDGNIMNAKPVASPQEMDAFLEEQRLVLQHHVGQ